MKGVCRHYNGLAGTIRGKCDAGIVYTDLINPTVSGWINRLPCMPKNRNSDACAACCKLDPITAEEAEAEDKEFEALADRMVKLDPLVASLKKKHKGESVSGEAECPLCGGVLKYAIAGSNGHVRMRCRTEGCVSFME